jgi:hypothetical protein
VREGFLCEGIDREDAINVREGIDTLVEKSPLVPVLKGL